MAHSDRVTSHGNRSKLTTPTVLVFHKLQASFSFGATNFSPWRFHRLLARLQASHFAINDQMTSGQKVLCSFDDGYQHLAKALPEFINKFGIRPIIFMPTGWLGNLNSWDYSYWLRKTPHLERREIRELSNIGVVFGSHGHSHVDLTSLTERQLKLELRQSREILADLAAQSIDSISYPFGKCNRRVIEAAEWVGYRQGFTMRFPQASDHALALGRVPIYGYDTWLTIRQKLGEGFFHQVEKYKVAITNQLSAGTILFNRLRRLD